MNTRKITARTSSLPILLMSTLLLISLLGCFDNEPDPDACDQETFETTCNDDGTVTACVFQGCGFGPCTAYLVETFECEDCTLVEGRVDYDRGETDWECALPSDDMGGDMSADGDMSVDTDMSAGTDMSVDASEQDM